MTPEQEKLLLDSIHADPKQFGILFDHFYKPIFGYIFRRVVDYDLARDVAAEIFLKAYLKIHKFQWKGVSMSAWLYKIATNEVNYYFRKQRYTPIVFQTILNHDLILKHAENIHVEEKSSLEEELQAHQDFLNIQQNLKQLDVRYQEVIALRYFENKDNKEISLILGKPEGTIKSLLSRGLEKLRNRMTQ